MINQTEALVAIDVNSGKATRERNIEETALKTNLEAAEEVGRQLKLRDLSGLIVIDFIDMEENRNKSAIERKLKDALRHDRARIQVGSISHFGLLEMSRQRLRPSLAESVSQTCPHCAGTGRIRSINSAALQILRVVEDEAGTHPGQDISIFVHPDVALYILNQKRASLASLEEQFGITILIEADNSLIPPDYRLGNEAQEPASRSTNKNGGRGRNNKGNKSARNQNETGGQRPEQAEEESTRPEDEDEQPKRKRRGRRGGRRRKRRGNEEAAEANTPSATQIEPAQPEAGDNNVSAHDDSSEATSNEPKAKKPRTRTKTKTTTKAAEGDKSPQESEVAEPVADEAAPAESDAPAKTQTKAKKAAATKTGAKKAKAKKATKTKTGAAKTKSAAAKKSESDKKRPAEPAASDQNTEGPSADQDRTPKSSVEMTVINVDEAPSAEKKKKGWWSR